MNLNTNGNSEHSKRNHGQIRALYKKTSKN